MHGTLPSSIFRERKKPRTNTKSLPSISLYSNSKRLINPDQPISRRQICQRDLAFWEPHTHALLTCDGLATTANPTQYNDNLDHERSQILSTQTKEGGERGQR